jgi:hypothetical protein
MRILIKKKCQGIQQNLDYELVKNKTFFLKISVKFHATE